jgi:hypothetical protein
VDSNPLREVLVLQLSGYPTYQASGITSELPVIPNRADILARNRKPLGPLPHEVTNVESLYTAMRTQEINCTIPRTLRIVGLIERTRVGQESMLSAFVGP